jgi:uncharacterized protein (TIGR02996 family)
MACHIHQDEDTPRLALADWLEEHDDPRGECVRLQVRLAAMDADDPEYDTLFDQHQKWWKKYGKLWMKDVGTLIWDAGPHDRGLPTIGYYNEEWCWLSTDDLQDPAKKPKDRLSAAIADGWSGLSWVLSSTLAEGEGWDEFDDYIDDFDEEEDDDGDEVHSVVVGETDPFESFRQPPWTGSPTSLGIYFPDGMTVAREHIDHAAKVPDLRGLSLSEADADDDLLPRIAKIKTLEHLDLCYTRLNDDGLRTLLPLKNLRTLIAPGATFTNKGAATLAKFKELRELQIGTRRLTAAGFQELAKLSKLEVLHLEKADDAAVRHLAPLTRLRVLNLSGTNVTGRGVEQFPLLTDLSLEGTQANDAGLANIATLKRLRHLHLSGTRITGELFSRLSGLRWLSSLFAWQINVGDKHLVHLEGLSNLESLGLSGTKITKKGSAKLQKKLKLDYFSVSHG